MSLCAVCFVQCPANLSEYDLKKPQNQHDEYCSDGKTYKESDGYVAAGCDAGRSRIFVAAQIEPS